jgi:hypothetical protein
MLAARTMRPAAMESQTKPPDQGDLQPHSALVEWEPKPYWLKLFKIDCMARR